MSELATSLPDVEIAPGQWDEFVKFVKSNGVRYPEQNPSKRQFRRARDVNTILSYMNVSGAVVLGVNTMNIPGEAGDIKYNAGIQRANYRADQIRQQILAFIQPKQLEKNQTT